jgi:tol-pal system protein YbgF
MRLRALALLTGAALIVFHPVARAQESAFTSVGLDALARLDAIEAQLKATTGENERLRYDLDRAKTEIQRLSDDVVALSSKVRDGQAAIAANPAPLAPAAQPAAKPAAPAPKPAVATATPKGPVPSFADGRNKLLAGDFDGADTALRAYVEGNPTGKDLAEAQYWIGEIAYVRGGYKDAAGSYVAALKAAPNGVRAPEAMVKLAASLRELGQKDQACSTLTEFAKRFPKPAPMLLDRATLERKRASCS